MKLFKKLFNYIVNLLNKGFRNLYIKFLMITKQSDYVRWSKKESLFSSWNERTILLSKYIKPNSVVFEFGAANLFLKDYLPINCTYLHADLVKRNDETMVIDLNKELPHLPISNYMVFSGVLEYIFDVKLIIKYCSAFTNNILFSYATFDQFPNTNNRRFNGWVSDVKEIEFIKLADEINFEIKVIGVWKKQTLYLLTKQKI